MGYDREIVRVILHRWGDEIEPKFLVLFNKNGYPQNPQGGIEPGETFLEAARREVLEETGLPDLQIMPWIKAEAEYPVTRKTGNERQHVIAIPGFVLDPYKPIVVDPKVHFGSGWLTLDDMLLRMRNHADKPELARMVVDVTSQMGLYPQHACKLLRAKAPQRF
ncbi:NUDIX hydrolase [Candidatus Woesearchaeota archaeon]|nr:NUDIX hydrolase [Candidatus Woesearchaeota archaeon]